MSRATKRKHVLLELLQDDYALPRPGEEIVRVVSSRGNNLHEVEPTAGANYLVSMPTKFRRNIWVKRGDFLLVVPIAEGDKVKAEIVRPLTAQHIHYYKKDGVWPQKFLQQPSERLQHEPNSDSDSHSDSDLFQNTNRLCSQFGNDHVSSSSSSSSDEDC